MYFLINHCGVATDPDKIEKVKNWAVPKNADGIRCFIALAG